MQRTTVHGYGKRHNKVLEDVNMIEHVDQFSNADWRRPSKGWVWDSAARKVERAQVQRFDERLATQAWLLQKLWKSRTLHSSSFHANDFKSRKMCKRVGSLKVFTCGYPGPTMPIVLVCPKLSKYVNDFTAPNERRSE